jgi:hypothetical protein
MKRILYVSFSLIHYCYELHRTPMQHSRYFEVTEVLVTNPYIPLHDFPPSIEDWNTFKALSIIGTKTDGVDINTDVSLIKS